MYVFKSRSRKSTNMGVKPVLCLVKVILGTITYRQLRKYSEKNNVHKIAVVLRTSTAIRVASVTSKLHLCSCKANSYQKLYCNDFIHSVVIV